MAFCGYPQMIKEGKRSNISKFTIEQEDKEQKEQIASGKSTPRNDRIISYGTMGLFLTFLVRCTLGMPAAVTWRGDGADGTQAGILDAAEYTRVKLIQVLCSGHYRGQLIQMAVIDQLEKLLVCPGSWGLLTQRVKDQQRGTAYLFKATVQGNGAAGAKRGAQVVQQVRDADQHGRLSQVGTLVGNGSCQVGFPTGVRSGEHQPALRRAGIIDGCLQRFIQAAAVLRGKILRLPVIPAAEGLLMVHGQRG